MTGSSEPVFILAVSSAYTRFCTDGIAAFKCASTYEQII